MKEPLHDDTVIVSTKHDGPKGAPKRKGLTQRQVLGTSMVLVFWLGLFLGGIVIDSAPFREALNAPLSMHTIAAAAMAGMFYTPTNIAILCLVAGLLGAYGRRAHLFDNDGPVAPPIDDINPLLSGLLRGFVVFLVLLSGLLLVVENPFGSPTQEQYVRLAGLSSLVSFLVSYDPRIFGNLMERIVQAIEGRLGNGDQS